MRISEVLTLPLNLFIKRGLPSADPDFIKNRMLHIQGKGGKERLVPLTPPAVRAVKAYLEVREHFFSVVRDKNPFLFASEAKEGHLTRQRVGQLLKELLRLASLLSDFPPYAAPCLCQPLVTPRSGPAQPAATFGP